MSTNSRKPSNSPSPQSSAQYKHLYFSAWKRASKAFLSSNPLCIHCLSHNTRTPATITDHIIPHKGNVDLFWDSSNWQPLCKSCHDSWKSRLERAGIDPSCSIDGTPTSPSHPWSESQ